MTRSEVLERKLTQLRGAQAALQDKIKKVGAQFAQAKNIETRPPHYKIGDRFQLIQNGTKGNVYVLVQVGNDEFNLIGLTSCNRWTQPLKRGDLTHTKIPSLVFHTHFTTMPNSQWELVS